MKQNMGTIDRGIRVLVAIIIAGLLFSGMFGSGALAIILAILAVVFLATSAIGFCPLYIPINLSTITDNEE